MHFKHSDMTKVLFCQVTVTDASLILASYIVNNGVITLAE